MCLGGCVEHEGVAEEKETQRERFTSTCGGGVVYVLADMLQLYLSKQRSIFLPLLNSIAACMLAPMWERQANRSTVNPIVLLYLLALDENQEVSKPLVCN